MALETMEDLLVHELRDLYHAEKQLLKALPKMAKAAVNDQLSEAFENHLAETEEQVARLEQCFKLLGVAARGKKCAGMEGLIEESSEVMEEAGDEIRDAAIIAAAQRIEHYEMAGYGSARAFAEQLGQDEVADLLTVTLEEEAAADELLTSIAESAANLEAPDSD
jgi:ferritin-like metal-binding protein YciE